MDLIINLNFKKMKRKILFFGVVTLIIVGLSSFNTIVVNSNLDGGKWVKLGSKKIDFKLDKDILKVGANNGKFTKLKIVVTNGKLNMHRMVVHYKNNTKEEIALRHNFAKGSDSRVIDLKGKKRIIKKIVFWFDTKNKSTNKATLTVFGRH